MQIERILIALSLVCFLLCRGTAQEIVAEIGNEQITKAELADRLIAQAGRAMLEEIISERLLQRAARQKGVSVSNAEVEARLRILQENAGGEQLFNQRLSALGLTPSLLRQQLRTQLLAEKVLEISVSDEEIQQYFDLNRALLEIPARVKLRWLVVTDEAKAKQAYERLRRGEPFTRVTAEMSDFPDVRADQGDFGTWQQYAGIDAVIEERAFKLQKGQFTEPFAYGSEFYILYAEEVFPAQPATLENACERIRVILLTRKWQSAYPTWLAEQRRTVPIKINMPER